MLSGAAVQWLLLSPQWKVTGHYFSLCTRKSLGFLLQTNNMHVWCMKSLIGCPIFSVAVMDLGRVQGVPCFCDSTTAGYGQTP